METSITKDVQSKTLSEPAGVELDINSTGTEWRSSCYSDEMESATVVRDDDLEENGP